MVLTTLGNLVVTEIKRIEGEKMLSTTIVNEISKKHHADDVTEAVDEAKLEYVDCDWDEDGEFDSEQDWYDEHCTNEAQDDVVNGFIDDYQKKTGTAIDLDQYAEINEALIAKWDL